MAESAGTLSAFPTYPFLASLTPNMDTKKCPVFAFPSALSAITWPRGSEIPPGGKKKKLQKKRNKEKCLFSYPWLQLQVEIMPGAVASSQHEGTNVRAQPTREDRRAERGKELRSFMALLSF